MIKPLHRKLPTATRCALLLAAPSRDWHLFKQICAAHWDGFTHAPPRYRTSYYDGLVATMRGCGNPEKMGSRAYRCLPGGQGKPWVALSGQASLCLRGAQVSVDTWVSQGSKVLHEGVMQRHLILTVPAMVRTTFYHNAAVFLSALMRCGVQCLDAFSREGRGTALKGGAITVLHPHGRHGQYPPPLHLIAPSGGQDEAGECWEHGPYLPQALLRRKWQWPLLSPLRKTLATDAMKRLVEVGFRQYPNGLVTNVPKGKGPSQSQSVARYVATDVVSPPLAVRRIDRYEGHQVTYHSRSHRPERVAHETVDGGTLIGRMGQHTMPQGFKRLRYDGVQATKTCAKVKGAMQVALAKGEGGGKGAVPSIARLTYRQRYAQRTGRDPLICPPCRCAMGLWRLWHPTYGVIYDEVQVIKRGTYASTTPRSGP